MTISTVMLGNTATQASWKRLSITEFEPLLSAGTPVEQRSSARMPLPDALTRLRKFGGRCAIGLQSIAQASTTYGIGTVQAMIENCGTTLILRCSASEGGGTARYASRLIGERDVLRLARSVSRSSCATFGSDRDTEGHSEHHSTESAVLAGEIEQLPDRAGFLKIASQPAWMRVAFPSVRYSEVGRAVPADPIDCIGGAISVKV
jgi:hypothetical protein